MLTKFHNLYRRLSRHFPVVGRCRIPRFLKPTHPARTAAVRVRHDPAARRPEPAPLLPAAAAVAETPPAADKPVLDSGWHGGTGPAAPGFDDPALGGDAVSKASLEQWISAGLLYPEEIKQAEKRIRDMQQRPRNPL